MRESPSANLIGFFELKYDGFRALAHLRDREATLIPRNDHPFSSFADLARSIMTALPALWPRLRAYFAVAAESRL
jgi:ATP-dependent DNA ligase